MKKLIPITILATLILMTACSNNEGNSDIQESDTVSEHILVEESVSSSETSAYISSTEITSVDTTINTTSVNSIKTTIKERTTEPVTKVTYASAVATTTCNTSVNSQNTYSTASMTPEVTTKAVNSDDFVSEVVRLVNVERANNGVSALSMDSSLNNAANIRSNEIITSFSHTRPDGSSCFTVLKELNISYNTCGENIAWGQSTPQQVVESWMNSEGHRQNILNSAFNKIGVGAVKDSSNGRYYWTQLFTN